MSPAATAIRAAALAHRRAEEDWLEAEALVEEHRRRAHAAAAHAGERLRAADAARRAGRADAFAMGLADGARLLVGRARAEAARLADAERRCAALRARADAARARVEETLGRGARPAVAVRGAPAGRLRCG